MHYQKQRKTPSCRRLETGLGCLPRLGRRSRPEPRTQQNSRFFPRRVGTSCGKGKGHPSKGRVGGNGWDFSSRAGSAKSGETGDLSLVFPKTSAGGAENSKGNTVNIVLQCLIVNVGMARAGWTGSLAHLARSVARAGDGPFDSSQRAKIGAWWSPGLGWPSHPLLN